MPRGVTGKKLPSDIVMNGMEKEELIYMLRLAQHNYSVLMQVYFDAQEETKKMKVQIDAYALLGANKMMEQIIERLEVEREDFEMYSPKMDKSYKRGVLSGIELAIDILREEIS